jgi:hypothetical protein
MDQRNLDHDPITSREALAWCAGFFDGEGSTYVAAGYGVALTIQQNHREPLERFREAIGYPPHVAHIYGPYVYKDKTKYGRYELRINGMDRVNAVLDLLWPWLGTAKREQAERTRQAWASRATTRQTRIRPNRKRDKLKEREYNQRYQAERRVAVLQHYGKVCACCGTDERLQITCQAQGIKYPDRGSSFYNWLIRNNFPPGFEVLCSSCALSKRTWGVCRRPHDDRKDYLLRVLEASSALPSARS